MEPSKAAQWSLRSALVGLMALAVLMGMARYAYTRAGLAFVLFMGCLIVALCPRRHGAASVAGLLLVTALVLPFFQGAKAVGHARCEFRILVRDAVTGAPVPNANIVVYERPSGTDALPLNPAADCKAVSLTSITDSGGQTRAALRMEITFTLGTYRDDTRADRWPYCVQASAAGYGTRVSVLPESLEIACRDPISPQAQPLVLELHPLPGQ